MYKGFIYFSNDELELEDYEKTQISGVYIQTRNITEITQYIDSIFIQYAGYPNANGYYVKLPLKEVMARIEKANS